MIIPRTQSLLKRLFSSAPTKNAIQHLAERSLIQIEGPDASEFLQGLITNDIHHLSNGVGSMFTVFLNIKGRILCDTLIYKTENKDVYIIECDSKATASLRKHLKIYKVKRKVDFSCLKSHKIYSLYNLNVLGQEKVKDIGALSGELGTNNFPENSTELKIFKDMYIFKDPRVIQLGFRIIAKDEANVQDCLKNIVECERSDSFKKLRYSLGVGEGTDELGNCNPLESNCDYLHGVSFHKGCYIGQELTARTHHTGVIRKRLMPLFFTKPLTKLPEDNTILHEKVNLGKLRGIDENIGLGLLRIKQALESNTITVGDGEAKVVKPDWWPIELPKEKLNIHATS